MQKIRRIRAAVAETRAELPRMKAMDPVRAMETRIPLQAARMAGTAARKQRRPEMQLRLQRQA